MDRGGRAVCRGRDCARWRRPGGPVKSQAQSQPVAQQGPRTDGQIEMDVVHALDASAALKNDLITAATIQSEVTLSGTVSTDASKQLAESIAAHVNGVTKVHNNLTVGNPGPDCAKPAAGPRRTGRCRAPISRRCNSKRQVCRLRDPIPQPWNQAPAPYPQQQGAYPPPRSAAAAVPEPAVFAISAAVSSGYRRRRSTRPPAAL